MRALWNTPPRWLVLLSLPIVLLAVIALVLYFLAPGLLERHIKVLLSEEGIEVEQLEVKQVGLTSSRFGSGTLRLHGQSFGWESVHAGYRPAGLLDGQIDHVTVGKPSLRLRIPDLFTTASLPEQTSAPDYSLEEVPSQQEEAALEEHYTQPTDGIQGPEKSPADPGQSVMAMPLQSPPDSLDLGKVFADLPVASGLLEHGLINIEWRDVSLLQAAWEGQFTNDPEQFSGELRIDSDMLSSAFTLTSHNPSSSLRLLGDMNMKPGPLMKLFHRLGPEFGFEPALANSFSIQHPIRGEILFESNRGALPRMSARMSTESIDWQPPLEGYPPLTILDTLLLATSQAGLVNLEGAGRFANYACRDFSVEPFGWQYSGNLSELTLRAEPIGIKRKSTLWLEDLTAMYSMPDQSFGSAFTWYNGAGTHMGDVLFNGRSNGAGDLSARIRLAYPDDQVFLTSGVDQSAAGATLTIDGELPHQWLNALGDWWWGRRIMFSGTNPSIHAKLDRTGYLLKGDVRMEMDSLNVVLSNGAILNDIVGSSQFRLNGLPSSDGPQSFRVKSLASGNIRIRNLLLEWSLPTMRNFRLIRSSGNIGSGLVNLDPFTCDPFDPAIKTSLRFEEIPAQELLDWIGEKRFSLQGTVSGHIPLQWIEGVLYVGAANLRMDSTTTENRFLFTDSQFLKQQFAVINGVPAELKEPFLATLLSDGIRIRDMGLDLAPDLANGEVVLRLRVSGETRSESMEVPIESLIINNVISDEDLGHVLGFLGPVRFLANP
ncbi:hypothetical protein G0Q06_01075 [Puniceicoccales bacterium CK1056]|uniref:Uncharacterized protein n=1 Tax=Oceanipulchritudo coccoides TaxID=2706888 RepID=A0A6B2LYM7_9BACT|nr:YdbH domain-containing protein [Oceanipulchritudo coccoides]NDV61034.1 hypothetical protein [Oceanipulchritudo coccoides]